MENKTVMSIETVIDYIEANLDGKLDLEMVAEAVHYSKYHLHRMFTSTVGMTIHDYVQRRQLTEAAKLLVFSDRPIIEVAFICGYESQQAFSSAFKSMYKIPLRNTGITGNFILCNYDLLCTEMRQTRCLPRMTFVWQKKRIFRHG